MRQTKRSPISKNSVSAACPISVSGKVVVYNSTTSTGTGTGTGVLGSDYDLEESVWCLNGSTAYRIVEVEYDETLTSAVKTVNWYDRPPEAGGVLIPNPVAGDVLTFGSCNGTTASTTTDITREVYRLDGNLSGTSTPINNVGVGLVGNSVVISAPFKSITPFILRLSENDPGDGSVANVIIDGLQYNLGTGGNFVTTLPAFSSDNNENFTEDMSITANGNAFLEIWVTR